MGDDDIATVATERVRGAATGQQNVPVQPEQFDRWLESVRAEERERIARNIEAAREGWAATGALGADVAHDAARIAREGA